MNTAPGIMPCSYSSCSRTSRNVASSPRRLSASAGRDLGDPRLGLRRAARGSWPSVLSPARSSILRVEMLPRGVGYSQSCARRSAQIRATRAGSTSPSGAAAHRVGEPSNGVGCGVDDHQAGAVRAARARAAPRPGRRRATCRARGTRRRRAAARCGPLEVLGHEVLAEADRRRLQHPAALEARGSSSPARTRCERLVHRARASRTAGTSPRARCRGSR